ncbi:DUF721 domain-containing protein [Rubripirellula reticaptiva]|uniref:DUF721 domain-containing protein n=1 Tax=Rubripirellula reticaptiva TaxID=2528013 RepID=A0A5C6FDZ5_9BACT|nr:DUF721 domain-containing protein [Rubripirellula reticaptiva]TWU57849.1 hypothetical protein Poly59_07580 [Rubripirellula reticaptiva]
MAKRAKSAISPLASSPDDKPKVRRIGSLISQLMSRKGYARSGVNEHLTETIVAAIGESLAASCRVGNLRAGVLQVFVSDSATLQELNFQKRAILRQFQKDVAGNKVNDIRFRIQAG